MGEPVGVQAGRVCPRCGREESVPLVWGLPGPDLMDLAERGLVALGGCMLPGEAPSFSCRACGLEWGSSGDPTADEQALTRLLGVEHSDVVRALGAGWRRENAADEREHVQWFGGGERAQVAVGVDGPRFVLARPLTRWEERFELQPADRREFGREDP